MPQLPHGNQRPRDEVPVLRRSGGPSTRRIAQPVESRSRGRHHTPLRAVEQRWSLCSFRSEHDFKSNPPKTQDRAQTFWDVHQEKAGPGQDGRGRAATTDERSQHYFRLLLRSRRRSKPKARACRRGRCRSANRNAIVLLFAANYAYKYFTRPSVEVNRVNRNPADEILARGGDPTQAVIEAAKALRAEKHSKNQETLKTAHARFQEKIDGLLNASPWTQQSLKDASRNVNEAFAVDTSPEVRRLTEEVNEETYAYQMSLLNVGRRFRSDVWFGPGRRGLEPGEGKGGDIMGASRPYQTRRSAEDTQRKNRLLTYIIND